MSTRRRLANSRTEPAVRAGCRPLRHVLHGSALVLAGLGLLGAEPAAAQTTPPRVVAPTQVPVVRGVVNGQVVVNTPVANSRGGQSLVVDQTTQRAIVDWRSFDIGRASDVTFYQPGTSASTLNRIHAVDPSVIQGLLRTRLWDPATGARTDRVGGQLLLLNQNGILFDRGSQVNVGSLIASTLNITNERFLSGVIASATLSATDPAFAGGYDDNGRTLPARPDGSRPGTIVLGGGAADASAPLIEAAPGGSVLLFAPGIDNQGGIIRAPDGQVILAAGQRAFLAFNPDSSDTTLRGLVVEVEADPTGSGLNLTNLVRNAGSISADRGNVTLAALAVNQAGRVSADTAVQLNGSVFLKGRSRRADGTFQAGTVTLATGSQTTVDPDRSDTTTLVESQDYRPFRGTVQIDAGTIVSQGTVRATGGVVRMTAADADNPSAARVYLDSGSQTSAAGAWTDVDLASQLVTFRVTSNELKNSPDQKDGILRGATVTVDLRQDSAVLDLKGYRDTVKRTVSEKAAVGGEINIASTGSLIQREGSVLDVSGGGFRYGGGVANTTRLLGADGRIYDIASAPQALRYVAQLDSTTVRDERWGQTLTFANPLGRVGTVVGAYSEGKAAGTLTLGSRAGLVLDGTLAGGVTTGAQQLARAPAAGTLRIGTGVQGQFYNLDQAIGNLVWANGAADSLGAGFDATTTLAGSRTESFTLAATQLFGPVRTTADGRVESGFGTVEVNSNGDIVVPASVRIEGDVGASLTLRARQIKVDGDVRLPAGALVLDPGVSGGGVDLATRLIGGTDTVSVGNGASLSTAGAWINTSGRGGAAVGAVTPTGRLRADGTVKNAVDGGDISVRIADGESSTVLARGASLDVGGGALLSAAGRVSGGRGGRLTIANGELGQSSSDWLQASLSGLSVGNGGELSLSLSNVQIAPDGTNGLLPSSTTRLTSGLFSELGFSRIAINVGAGAIDVLDDTALTVRQANRVVDAQAALGLASGADLASVSTTTVLPDSQRSTATLALSGARIDLPASASISADPRGQISLAATQRLEVDGALTAPGGTIALSLNGALPQSTPDLHVGSTARLSTAGTFVRTPDSRGLTLGTLYDGGSIAIAAAKTGVRIDAGAVLDVSGVNQVVDLVGGGSQPAIGQRTLSGHAGTVSVRSEGATLLAGSMLGHGGDAAAAGGSFVLDVRRPDGQPVLAAAPRIVVTANGQAVPAVPGTVDSAVNVQALRDGGFEKLRLAAEGSVRFEGTSSLVFERGIRIDAPRIDLGAGADVLLFGSTVALGNSLAPRQLLDGVWSNSTPSASPTPTVTGGDAVLRVEGGTVDLFGSFGISGTRLTRVSSYGDLRLIGREVDRGSASFDQAGELRAAGDLDLRAAQVYPATRTDYTISLLPSAAAGDGSRLSIATPGNGNPAGDVYSAGGSLRLEADTIVQAGIVKAPHGQLDLKATRRLELAPGSLTSVSGAGLTVLYGTTESGVTWSYVDGGSATGANVVSNGTPVESVSGAGKRIDLSAPAVTVAGGARVDLSGGGDVRAVEFVAGNGGDSDATRAAGTFAIIPKSRLASMPFDNDLQRSARGSDTGFGFSVGSGRDSVLYDAIDIGPGAAVPAGQYVLLPARYALLPDAFLVQLQTGSAYRNLQPGQTTALTNGDVVVAGHRVAAGTSVRESQSVGVVVLPGSALSRRSDYTLSGARLLAEAAERERSVTPAAPWDAGRLTIAGASTLDVRGSFQTASAASPTATATREAQVDIASARIAVVGDTPRTDLPADVLQLGADSISAFNASVLLGGTRTRTADGVRIDTTASDVRVANDAASPVVLPELVLAARSSIDIDAGSVLRASGGNSVAAVDVIRSEASGALVRLSTGSQASVDRGTASSSAGDVRIGAGAVLAADGALLVDATRSTQSLGQLRAGGADGTGGALTLSAGRISLGGDTGAGLALSQTDLAAYASLDSLVLRGYQGIDLVGRASLGSDALASLTLDTPQLRGVADAAGALQVSVRARELTLANQGADATPAATTGSGTLAMAADRLVVGAGQKAVSGFADVTLQATQALSIEGEGRLRAAADLTLRAPLVQAQGGAAQGVEAAVGSTGALAYRRLVLDNAIAAVTPASPETAYGGRVEFAASDIRVDTTVRANSGLVGLQAMGAAGRSGDIALQAGAVLDASGLGKDFNGTRVVADGGRVALSAAGAMTAVGGSVIDVSAAAEGGAAGTFALRAASADLQGRLDGSAGAGQRSGSATLDLDRLGAASAFSTLNAALDRGGFDEERRLRLRSGDIVVAATDDVQGRRVSLQADAGRIDVAGTVGSGAAAGSARVDLLAANGIALTAGSRVLAGASNAGARGGEVRVATQSGTLAFDAGSTIDVRAGQAGPTGSVVFGVRRDAAHAVGATDLRGTVLRGDAVAGVQASVDVEATRVYAGAEAGSALSAARMAQLGGDHQAFVTASAPTAAAVVANLRDEGGALRGARLLGATELRAAGDLSVDATWDLTSAAWLSGAKPGTLTLRAAGNLTLRDTVGAPRLATNSTNATTNNNNQLVNHAIRADDTWSIRMTAGADLAAADPLAAATRSGSGGNLLLTGANAGIRTGTGRIDLAAAGDLRMDNVAQAIYTAGRIGAADTAAGGANRWAVDGGSISLSAGADIVGPAGGRDLWVTEWLRRDRVTPTEFARNPSTDWWAYRPRFQQAVGTLAGGDIEIVAGGRIDGVSAMLPTLGRTTTDASGARQIEVSGGGNLVVRAGGDIRGGAFLVGRGQGRVEAGGDIGSGRDVQLYVMGASSGAVPESARVDLVAGGDVNLRSVNNPTLMTMIGTTGATGPSFGTQPTTANNNTPTRFFTYSSNSAVALQSKAGDVDVEGWIAEPTTYADRWRGFLATAPNLTFAALGSNTAFPASFSAVALAGDVSGPRQERRIVTYPSPAGTVALLAAGNVADFSLTASDLAPSDVVTPFTRFTDARGTLSTSSFDTGSLVLPTLTSPRITARDAALPPGVVSRDAGVPAYAYDVQALEGSVGTTEPGQPVRLVLPGPSRVRAGVDVVDVVVDLGHLTAGDVSVVRADSGDIRYDAASGGRGVTISGPGRLVLQAGRNIDLQKAAVAATGEARLTLAAGMSGDLDLARLGSRASGAGGADGVYGELIALNRLSSEVLDLYGQLAVETDPAVVLAADSIASLASSNPAYGRFASLDTTAPRALQAYQAALRPGTALSLPLGSNAQADAAQALYRLLNTETDLQRLVQAGSLGRLAAATGGEAYRPFVALGESFPRLYADYVQRRSKGAVPTAVTPIVFSDALATLVAEALPTASVSAGGGSILSYLTSVQTFGGGDIDLLAPKGNVVAGLTTPQSGATVGVLTLGGGAIRSIVGGDFNVNQGKVITAAGGDILLFSSAGSIDAGRGAKTSVSTPPPQVTRNPDGTTTVSFSAAATGSGIQSLSSDPDGVGPRLAPRAGDVYLFAPAGSIDAGEAGIRSGGNILVNAQAVRNASDIRAGGNSQGVPVAVAGSVASTVAASGTNTTAATRSGEESAGTNAARAAAAAAAAKPNILTVDVLGFGDKNCKEGDKDCFAK